MSRPELRVIPGDRSTADFPLTPEQRAAFEDFVLRAATVQRRVDQDLTQETRLTLSEYTALRRLSEAAEGRLRLTDLAAAMGLSLSRISRMVAKLEQRGLVFREPASEDGRGWNAIISGVGRARLGQSEPAYAASVRRNFLDHLDTRQLEALSALMAALGSLPPPP